MLLAEGGLPELVAARLIRIFMAHASLDDGERNARALGRRAEDVPQVMKSKMFKAGLLTGKAEPVPQAIF